MTPLSWKTVLAALLLSANPAVAEEAGADISLTARVHADTLRFQEAPQIDVRFAGTPGRVTSWQSHRPALPSPVQPQQIYHDVTVEVSLSSQFDPAEAAAGIAALPQK